MFCFGSITGDEKHMKYDVRGKGPSMRTTLTVDDDVLSAVRKMAVAQNKTVGEVISSLARHGLNSVASRRQTRSGVPLLQLRPGTSRVTSDLVHELREDLP
jgi:hypothetical protein